ncbi:MAG: efflux RND transporter periplasmic adaptor subunit [Kofleriaceae bacterium]|nr:efflux RND transporter periplasmic adaptor subunit [Kofleriaceae bacterium]
MKSILIIFSLLAACKSGDKASASLAAGDKGHGETGEAHEAEGHAEGGVTVHLTPEQIKSASIQLATVETRKETAVLEANGQIAAADDRQARIGVRVPGRVTAIKAAVGDTVKKGQTLAVVESPELGRAKSDYVSAAAAARLAKENATREKQLFERSISAEVEWRKAEAESVRTEAELQAAENRLHALGVGDDALPDKVAHFGSSLTAASPIAGVIVDRDVTLGEMVNPEKTLFHVMDLSQVWLIVDVFERDVSQVALKQKVKVQVTAYKEEAFEGEVSYIGAVVEPRSRAVKVRIALPNAEGRLKPGMFARVSLSDTKGTEHEHLFVPVEAVQRTDKGPIVFVPGDKPGEFAARSVKTGHEAGNSVAIETGLSAGDQVVVAGSFILKSELNKESLGEGGHSD